ncbi:MAG: hypothetical protein HYV93_00440 [Candidatus Rokubacteria bacterium]|nr:hypothetical protein [Candidatus Rokubacteria bacterium]
MFLVAIGRRRLLPVIDGSRRLELVAGRWHVTALAAGPLAHVDDTGTLLTVTERPLSRAGAAAPELAEVAFDPTRHRLDVRRQPRGGRLVYYTVTPDGDFLCATHVWLLRRAGIPIQERRTALPEFFVYCYVMAPATMFENIHQVPYGGSLRVDLDEGGLKVTASSGCDFLDRAVHREAVPDADLGRTALDFLSEAVRPLGATQGRVTTLLSGGVDSSLLARLADRLLGTRETYSTSYPFEDDASNAEKEYPITAATALGMCHRHHEPTTAEYLDAVLSAIAAVEQPLHGLQTPLLAALFTHGIAEGVSVLLCGEGADNYLGVQIHEEIFQGRRGLRVGRYLARRPIVHAFRLLSRLTWKAYAFRARLERWQALLRPVDDPEHPLWEDERYGDPAWARSYFGVASDVIIENRLRALRPFLDRDLLDVVSILALLGSTSAVQGLWSRLADATGRALVFPFTEATLMGYAFGIPWERKLASPKHLARLMSRQAGVPEFILDRPKSGFGIHARRWAMRGGPLEPLVPLAVKVVPESLIRAVQRPPDTTSRIYWNLLNYALWKRLVVDGEPLETLRGELADSVGSCSRSDGGTCRSP